MWPFCVCKPPTGVQLNLTANFGGFNTTIYEHQGCKSTTCEGVAELKYLMVSERPLWRRTRRILRAGFCF